MSGRAAFIVTNILIVILSVATGLGRLPMPPALRVALTFWSLFILPGLAIGRLAGGRDDSILESICRLFVRSLVFVMAVLCLGFLPGVRVGALYPAAGAVVVVILAAGLFLRPARRGDQRGSRGAGSVRTVDNRDARGGGARSRLAAAIILFVACFFFLYGTGDLTSGTDSLDHMSFIRRSLESGTILPHDSFYREGDGAGFDQRKGLWHPAVALWAAQANVAPDVLWSVLPAYCGFMALTAFTLFAREVTASHRWAALSLILMTLFHGGEGAIWLTKVGFSRNLAMVILWIDLALIVLYCRTRRRGYLVEAAAAAAAGVAVHLAFALMLAVSLAGLALYVLCARGVKEWQRPFAAVLAACAVAAAVPLVARLIVMPPAWSAIHTHRQAMLLLSNTFALVDPNEILTRESPVFAFILLMAPFYFLAAPRIERRGLPFVLFAVPVAIVINPVTAPVLERGFGYLHYRIIDAAPLMPMLALILGGLIVTLFRPLRVVTARSMVGRVAAAAAIILFVWCPLRMSQASVREAVSIFERRSFAAARPYEALRALVERETPPCAVIATDPYTGYVISAFTDRYIVAAPDQHCSPADTAALLRLRELRDLLSPAVPLVESAAALGRWDARYILVNAGLGAQGDFFRTFDPGAAPATIAKIRACPVLREIAAEAGYILFSVEKEWPADDGRCQRSVSVTPPCGAGGERIEREVGCAVELERIALERDSLAAGDTLRANVCWRPASLIEFGLPVDVTIRIDAPFPRGRWYRNWYGKLYRRWIERRGGAFFRVTRSAALQSGYTYPDQWRVGEEVRQEIVMAIPQHASVGIYDLHLSVRRVPYLPVRTLADYLRNRDSFDGVIVGRVHVLRAQADRGEGCRTAPSRSEGGAL